MSRLLSYLAILAVLAMHQPVAAGPNANARVSVDLIPNGGAGNQRNDGVTSGTVSGRGTTIAIEVFATGVTTRLVGMQLRFDFDATLLTFVKTENSAFPFNVPQSTGTDFAVTSPVRLPSSGFLTRAEFTTATDVTGRAFSIGLASVVLSESVTSRDTLTTDNRIEFNATGPPTPDFDGDGTVGFSDFLPFAGQYGARRGDGRYQAKYDLNSDGAIDFSDFLLFVSSYGNTIPPSGSGSETVEIPDANLRAVISDSLNKARGAPITRADMETLRRISAGYYAKINNLTGLEFATHLTRLDLGWNRISDITALAGLTNLTWLLLNDTQISDITALSGLTKLDTLSLSNNRISDITALAGLTKLRLLYLDGNQISDITALSGLTNLTALSLGYNRISDITALSGLTNLRTLGLYNNQVSDIAALAGLTKLTRLNLSENQLSDITALSGLTNLERLNLYPNPLSATSINTHIPALRARGVSVHFYVEVEIPDAKLRAVIGAAPITRAYMATLISLRAGHRRINNLTGLEFATNLEYLYLGGNQLSDIAALSTLTNLTWLSLVLNQLSDIAALSGLTNLTWLNLSGNRISDITALSGLTKLDTLDLQQNQVSDIAALSGLTNLTWLNLSANRISDIAALAGLTKLGSLYLDGNQISDITALSGLTNLTELYLNENQISDITALAGLTKLTSLDLRNNPLSATSKNTHIPALRARGVRVIWE